MEFQDYKKKYDELMLYKRNQEDVLNQNKAEFNGKRLESIELNNICNIIKKEIGTLNTKYNQHSESRFKSINTILKILLGILSLIACIISFVALGGGILGLAFALLCAAGFNIISGIVLMSYYLICHTKPLLITRFWKKDEVFKGLETSIKEKEKELEKNLQLYEISTENLESLNERISESESYIREIDSQIIDLLISYSTKLFDDSENDINNNQINPYTKIRRP